MGSNNYAADRNQRKRVCDHTLDLVRDLAKGLNTKVARRLRSALQGETHNGVLELTIDPSDYSNADLFARDWLAVNVMRKHPGLNLGLNTEEEAYKAFHSAEITCRETNARMRRIQRDAVLPGISGESMIHMVRQKIVSLIGDAPNLDDIGRWGSFSSGASTRLTRRQGDCYHKLHGRLHVTRKAALLGLCYITSDPLWSRELRRQYGCNPYDWVEVVPGNRVTTVPKNAKTDRTIAIEPELNMLLQKAVGKVFRRFLRKVGINLNDQTRNQRLAFVGSLFGTLATLDLKAASDTIALEVVRLLLPKQWVDLLEMLRSECGELPDGSTLSYEKFSSMGNGFTFELESLIFWAITSVVTDLYVGEHQIGVYGDDLVCPSAVSGWLVEVLQFFGFQTNDEKSFVAGPFRESCGKHYFNGVDVTPFSIDYPIIGITDLYLYANSVRRWASGHQPEGVCDPRYRHAYDAAVNLIPTDLRYIIPDDAGDRNGLIGTLAEFSSSKNRPRDRRKYRCMAERVDTIGLNCGTAYVRALMLGEKGEVDDSLVSGPVSRRWELIDRPRTAVKQHWETEEIFLDQLVLRPFRKRYRRTNRYWIQWSDSCYWPS